MRSRASLVCFAELVAFALQQQQCPSQPPAPPSPAVASLVITTDALPHATLGRAYTAQLQASGGTPPYTWRIASGALPPGLTLHAAGTISGIRTAAGNYDFTAEVKDAGRIALATRRFAAATPRTPRVSFAPARSTHSRGAPGS